MGSQAADTPQPANVLLLLLQCYIATMLHCNNVSMCFNQYSNVQIEDTPKLAEASIIVPINYPKMEQRIPLHIFILKIDMF